MARHPVIEVGAKTRVRYGLDWSSFPASSSLARVVEITIDTPRGPTTQTVSATFQWKALIPRPKRGHGWVWLGEPFRPFRRFWRG